MFNIIIGTNNTVSFANEVTEEEAVTDLYNNESLVSNYSTDEGITVNITESLDDNNELILKEYHDDILVVKNELVDNNQVVINEYDDNQNIRETTIEQIDISETEDDENISSRAVSSFKTLGTIKYKGQTGSIFRILATHGSEFMGTTTYTTNKWVGYVSSLALLMVPKLKISAKIATILAKDWVMSILGKTVEKVTSPITGTLSAKETRFAVRYKLGSYTQTFQNIGRKYVINDHTSKKFGKTYTEGRIPAKTKSFAGEYGAAHLYLIQQYNSKAGYNFTNLGFE